LATVREAGGAGEQVEEGRDGGESGGGNGRQVQVEVVQQVQVQAKTKVKKVCDGGQGRRQGGSLSEVKARG
jgi:hypothetical protein